MVFQFSHQSPRNGRREVIYSRGSLYCRVHFRRFNASCGFAYAKDDKCGILSRCSVRQSEFCESCVSCRVFLKLPFFNVGRGKSVPAAFEFLAQIWESDCVWNVGEGLKTLIWNIL